MQLPDFADLSRRDAGLRAGEFVALVRELALADGDKHEAMKALERRRLPGRVTKALQKAAVAGGGVDTETWGSELAPYREVSAGFLASLHNTSVFDAIAADFAAVPPHSRTGVLTGTVTGATPGEGQLKPIGRIEISASTLAARKALAVVVVTEELLRFGAEAERILSRELRRAVSVATNTTFLTALLSGVTPIASSGTEAEDVLADIAALLQAVPTGSASRLHLVMDSTLARRLTTMSNGLGGRAFPEMTPVGGRVASINTLASDDLPDPDTVALIDASQIAGNAGELVPKVSRHALIHMTDGQSPEGDDRLSLFQTDSVALMVERIFGFDLLRPDAVAALSGVAWGAAESPA